MSESKCPECGAEILEECGDKVTYTCEAYHEYGNFHWSLRCYDAQIAQRDAAIKVKDAALTTALGALEFVAAPMCVQDQIRAALDQATEDPCAGK